VASAAVELAGQIFSSLAGKTVLLVGAGRMAEAAARALLRCGATRLVVANRTLERAQQLARDLVQAPPPEPCDDGAAGDAADGEADAADGPVTCPAVVAEAAEALRAAGAEPAVAPEAPPVAVATEAIGLEGLAEAVARADLVIASAAAEEPLLAPGALAPALRRREGPVLVIDIAVPRNVDPRLADLDNVYLYNIDDLDRLVERNLARRRQEVPKAEAIVEFEVAQFDRWLASRGVAPTIRLLQRHLAAIREGQIERYGRKFSDADRGQLDVFTQALCSQILHKPLALLKDLASNGSTSQRLATVDLVRHLFDLDALDDDR